MRLDKYLADMGVGKRSELKKWIRSGKVRVGETMIKDPGFAVQEESEVFLNGEQIRYRQYVYYLLNKPSGVISATEDPRQSTVLDLLPEQRRKDLFPVGRLDKDTEGLLLITNDGVLAHQLLSPKRHVDKVYFARLDKPAEEKDIRAFADGIELDDFTALPAELSIPDPEKPEETLVTIREGKFHQIKRMFLAQGKEVVYLKRLSMGTLQLDEKLEPGEYRELTDEELCGLKGRV
ncbi:MAG: pseudouridine synthase [Eubacteriales bacterium]|nr:pseudouridine synthase [Eubacteriales bacterium]